LKILHNGGFFIILHIMLEIFEDLINKLTDKLKIKITAIYFNDCYVVLSIIHKSKKLKDNWLNDIKFMLEKKLSMMTGFEIIFTSNELEFLSVVGTLITHKCSKQNSLVIKKNKRRKF
jgi:hypothetical protein